MKKSRKITLVIVAIMLLIGIVFGTYFFVKNKQVTNFILYCRKFVIAVNHCKEQIFIYVSRRIYIQQV